MCVAMMLDMEGERRREGMKKSRKREIENGIDGGKTIQKEKKLWTGHRMLCAN